MEVTPIKFLVFENNVIIQKQLIIINNTINKNILFFVFVFFLKKACLLVHTME